MILYKNELSVESYNQLREAVGWGALDPRQAKVGLENSAFLIAAYDGAGADAVPVGAARVISDGGYMMLIADVMVLPEYQRQGIGAGMLRRISGWIEEQAADGRRIMVNLMATGGNEPFYEKFGFIVRPNDQMGAGMVRWLNG